MADPSGGAPRPGPYPGAPQWPPPGPPAPPPPPPGWGQPQGGGWGAPPPGPAPATSKTDPLAISALVLGLLPGLCSFGIVLGIVALVRIRKSHRAGKGMAITGILAGLAWLAVTVVLVVVVASSAPERGPDGSVTEKGTVSLGDLRVGDCPGNVPGGSSRTVEVVPCTEPHAAEVYATFDLTSPSFPGDDDVTRFASGGCNERLGTFVGADRQDAFDVYFVGPNSTSWRLGDREVVCVLTPVGGGDLPPGSAKRP